MSTAEQGSTTSNNKPIPWFSRRNLVILGALFIMTVAALGVGLALSLGRQSSGQRSASAGLQQTNNNNNEPTMAPSLRPSMQPSAAPSDRPSQVPSTPPSASPSQAPSFAPTTPEPTTQQPTSFPTRKPYKIDSFRLKLYWKKGYFWQEEDFEREWCLECVRCNPLTIGQFGVGCRDAQKDKFDCQNNDQLWLQRCRPKNGGNAEFEVVHSKDDWSDRIKIKGKNLCLERVKGSPRLIVVRQCQDFVMAQKWIGFDPDREFSLKPMDRPDRCVSQNHHPKANEVIYAEDCHLAHIYDTGLWQAI